MPKKPQSVIEQLRAAIARAERGGLTRYAIAKAAKMPRSQLTRVANGDNMPRLDTAERIAQAIGCKLGIMPIVAP